MVDSKHDEDQGDTMYVANVGGTRAVLAVKGVPKELTSSTSRIMRKKENASLSGIEGWTH